MYFKQIYEEKLAQYSYLIGCQETKEAIVIDPMRDVDQYNKLAEKEGLEIIAAADTHIHADYLSGLREFAEKGVTVYASDEGGEDWQYEWLKDVDYHYEFLTDGDTFHLGNVIFDVIYTPGHTPESLSYLLTDGAAAEEPMGILTGDFVFVGDIGRPDLLETAAGQQGAKKPAARELYQSVEAFKELPEYLQVWPAHGSGSACGKVLGTVPESTVGYELRNSPAFTAAISESNFLDCILEGQPEPPLYFGRMKRINRAGPPVLGGLPQPSKLTVDEMVSAGGTILDTRQKHDFMKGHIKGSLLTTFDKNFNTIAGSYTDADEDIYLIIDEEDVEQAVCDLIRVGIDHIEGFVTPEELQSWNGELETIEAIDFETVVAHQHDEDVQVLDVRKATEYNEDHLSNAKNIAHTRLA